MSADAARCTDRNLHTYPVARRPGPPRDQRALLLGTQLRRTRWRPRPSTHGRVGRRGTHTNPAANTDRGRDGPDHQQSSQHVKPCLLSFMSRGAALVAGATPMAVAATAHAATTRVGIIWHPPLLILKMCSPGPVRGSAYIQSVGVRRRKGISCFPTLCLLATDRNVSARGSSADRCSSATGSSTRPLEGGATMRPRAAIAARPAASTSRWRLSSVRCAHFFAGSRSVFLRAASARCRATDSSSRFAGYQPSSAASSARRR